ncbi:hypothetical protein TREMEDRAFT_40794 [Tremella mesenterica DSM 1558]|uniref:uncharacterized protein n=1 Tax=Tremella mesenterica (strain ATCC 24925 / CBS 8224 / DSM 1558 / NBRC 9311 / NRRL Y-6157 / RJB 2259-6 / UBC 559-6) TaxID=578456 RepID=UPI00032C6EEF|nr:uncharacterized protein TREMEDRAFT_40794 [Tremella mesenterica DSM 1558]EIW66818.1 hypothetical protein TREMEDRAFT_40794 [Tremella mesenterica DSM 1558]
MSMLDDFVEHSAGPSLPRHSSGAYRAPVPVGGEYGIDAVEYEGFEPDLSEDSIEGDTSLVTALETGFIPSSRNDPSLSPLFALSLVQYSPPSAILHLVSSNNHLFLATNPLSIVIIDLNKPEDLLTILLPRPAPDKGSPNPQTKDGPVIHRLFVDPAARHLIITTTTGDAFYLPLSPGNPAVQSRRPRPLRLRAAITAVGWSPVSGTAAEGDNQASKGDTVTPPATDVLLGTTTGQILSLPLPPQDDIFKSVAIGMSKPLERDMQTVYTLPDPQPVTGVAFGFWPAASKGGKRRAWVVITTNERMYEVQGDVSSTVAGGKGGGWVEEVFKPAREGAPKFQELPGQPPNSELKVYLPVVDGQNAASLPAPSALAWLTAPGLYASPIAASSGGDILPKPSLLPYPLSDESTPPPFSRTAVSTTPRLPPVPISVSITQWHWLLLYPTRIVGISRESEKQVWEENLPLAVDERATGLSSDPVSKTFWIFTDRAILEVLVSNEDRDVWRAKVEKSDFVEALRYARTPAQKDIVLSRQGDYQFEQGRYIQAAQSYAKSSRNFEFVALRFVDADERDALRVYLSDCLDRLDKKDRTQRMMLATWLIEIYLSKCNTLEDIVAAESATSDVESLKIERQMMEEDMRNFISTYLNDLEPKVVYELILSHGRTDLYLFYADLKKDHERVVEHWVDEEDWLKAIDVLNRQTSVELYYRFASILMRFRPKETVDAFIRQPVLSPRRLIPALLQYSSPPPPVAADHTIRYLLHLIHQQHLTDTIIYNLLITRFATHPDPDSGPLLRFLMACPDDPLTEKPYYDLDYALRLCKQNNRVEPCVLIYSKMGLYENSVDLALSKGDLELAKINADRPEDDEGLRRKLWLKIARYVVQEQRDIKSAMKFLEATDLIKIEDILPFFPDFSVIDDFKSEICAALEEYSAKIDALRSEMDEATQSAEAIRKDIDGLSGRFVTIDAGDKCGKCGLGLVSRQFYVFPCQHGFHADCLISMAMEYLPAPSLRRILHLQNELIQSDISNRTLLSSNFTPNGSRPETPSRKGKESLRSREITSGSAATDALLGLTGRNQLLAAGDKLRELIIPDALAQAVSAGFTSIPGVGGNVGKKGKTRKDREREEEKSEAARKELDGIVAAVCPLCEGAVVNLDKGFIKENEDARDWEV